jgi:hypothetical protein
MDYVISVVDDEYILVECSGLFTYDLESYFIEGVITKGVESDISKVLIDGTNLESFDAVNNILIQAQALSRPSRLSFITAVVANWIDFSQDPQYTRALESHEKDLKRQGGICKTFDDLGFAEGWLRLAREDETTRAVSQSDLGAAARGGLMVGGIIGAIVGLIVYGITYAMFYFGSLPDDTFTLIKDSWEYFPVVGAIISAIGFSFYLTNAVQKGKS